MEQETKESIVKQIVHIAQNTQEINKDLQIYKIILAEGVAFSLPNDSIDEYEKLIERLLKKEGWNEKFSEKHINKVR